MDYSKKILSRVDHFQAAHTTLAFPFAVWKKHGDDQAGNLAALVTYYAFLSLFPLLIVGITIIEIVIGNSPHLQQAVLDFLFRNLPVIGGELQRNIHGLHQHGLALVVSLLVTIYGALGIGSTLQLAANTIWQVERHKRPGFPKNNVRSLGSIMAGAGLLLSTGAISFVVAQHTAIALKAVYMVMLIVASTACIFAIYRLSVAKAIHSRTLLLGTVVATIGWFIIQAFGTYIMFRHLHSLSTTYGAFTLVLGLLFWIYLIAQLCIYAMEINVVHSRHLWPRHISEPNQKL